MKNKIKDISQAVWPDKIFYIIDAILNPKASDWPVGKSYDGKEKVYMIRWMTKKHEK